MLKYPHKLDIIFNKLNKSNIKPIFVGGYVRDYFLQIDSKDIDIELYGANNFEQIVDILKEFGNTNLIGKSFGIIKLNIDDIEIDFSLPRLDNKISTGHKGFEVKTFKNLDFKIASKRRDFTINAIGYDVNENKFLDYYHGIDDLKNKKLRYIDKISFKEDPLRVLRAVQFCARFEFKMDADLFSTCREMVINKQLEELPHERVFKEIKKLLLKATKPSIGLVLLQKLNINFFKINDEKLKNIDYFTSLKTTNNKINLVILLAILYKDTEYDLQHLTNSKTLSNNIKKLLHVERYICKKTKTISYDITKDLDLNILSLFLKALHVEDKILNKLHFLKPTIHGKDLIQKGLKPSKEFKNILQTLYNEQLTVWKNLSQ